MKKMISFALLGAFLAVSSIGCTDDKKPKTDAPKKTADETKKPTETGTTPK